MVDGGDDFAKQSGCFMLCVLSVCDQVVEQVASCALLHYDVHISLVFEGFEEIDNVWMVNDVQQLQLAPHQLQVLLDLLLRNGLDCEESLTRVRQTHSFPHCSEVSMAEHSLESIKLLDVCLGITLTAHFVGNIGAHPCLRHSWLAELPVLSTTESHIITELRRLKVSRCCRSYDKNVYSIRCFRVVRSNSVVEFTGLLTSTIKVA